MQLSEQQINLLRELLDLVEYDPASPTQEKVHKALEALDGLRAQADARPVLWWNGIRKGEAGDFVGPSFSEKEDTNHDIPLVSAVNPCNIAPVDMVLHCPNCGLQHIDHPEPAVEHEHGAVEFGAWDNPPHRSHLCHGCGHIWRPADVPTNGVLAIKTKGQNDSPITGPDRVDDTHPEASAPGLSDDVSSVRAALIGLANHVRAVPAYSKLLGDMEQVDKAIAILTRASAATVAEPTVVRCVRFCPISDIECTKQCGAICHHEATQQAEPRKCSTPDDCAENGCNGSCLLAVQQAEPKCVHRIVDARNPVVKSGYLCIDCGAVFSAADHDGAKQPAEPSISCIEAMMRALTKCGVSYGEGGTDAFYARLEDNIYALCQAVDRAYAPQQAEPAADEQAMFMAAVINLAELPESAHEKPFPNDDMNTFWAVWKAALAAHSGQRAGVAECKWSPDSDFEGDTWDSACGEKWSFIDGGPVENRVRFCQGCGGRVVLAAPTHHTDQS